MRDALDKNPGFDPRSGGTSAPSTTGAPPATSRTIEGEFSCVGKPLPRPDVAAKATGAAVYGADLVLPGMLTGRILTSPYAHAKILSIDTSKAKALAGVAAVITHEDVPKLRFTRSVMAEGLPPFAYEGENQDQFILSDKARYVGDWIAAVAAVDTYTAEKALDLIEVEYEQLPAVFDPEEALKPGSPIIHEGWPGNVAGVIDHPFSRGDLDKALADSDYVVEFRGRNSRQKQAHLEPDVAVARWEPDGRLTVWSPNQNAHLAKKTMAQRILGINEGDIRWITTTVGGGFGARLSFGVEPVAVLLAKITGKPVKVFVTREEDFSGWSSRTEQRQTIRMGVTKGGTITAIEQRILSDAGAYFSHSGTISAVNMQATLGVMRSPVVSGKATIVYTNNPTSSGMRGYGNPEGSFVLQQAIDMAAEKCGMDPLEFRLKNAKGTGEPSMWEPVTLTSCALETCIRLGAERIGWKEKWHGWGASTGAAGPSPGGRYRRGVGMSIMTHASGAGGFLLEHSSAIIKLDEDGSVQLAVSPCEMGQGILGALSQIAAEGMGLRYEDVHVITGDTDVTLFDIGSHASRSTYAIGNAVLDAARQVRATVLERAAGILETSPRALDIRGGSVFVKADPTQTVAVAEIARGAIYDYGLEGRHITATGKHQALTHCPNFQAGFSEIEVDTETGVIKVLKYVVAHDIGRAINPLTVESCLQGGAYQGLGYALTEDLIIDEHTGKVLTDSFATYKMLSALDMPEVEVILVEEPDPSGPYGAKGVGETGITNVAPSIANALYDACRIRIHSLPMTPEKVLAALAAAPQSPDYNGG
ncbi:MAG: molybdopterin-dependent oxidoreductase [Actinobacteria bacterium]|nr:molybdopterin-dependent oxidoreductase [Actinomycetota bacterium]